MHPKIVKLLLKLIFKAKLYGNVRVEIENFMMESYSI